MSSGSVTPTGSITPTGTVPAVQDPYQVILQQLKDLNTSLSANGAIIAATREESAAIVVQMRANTQALGDLQLGFGRLENTFKTSMGTLRSTIDDGLARLHNTLEEDSRAEEERHRLLIETIQRYMPAT